jgi:hypothetical protein
VTNGNLGDINRDILRGENNAEQLNYKADELVITQAPGVARCSCLVEPSC